MTTGTDGVGLGPPSGTWIRSSSREAYVFHPEDEPLPRARGLQTLELAQDGVARRRAPGRDDRSGETTGHWTLLAGDRVEVSMEASVLFYRLEQQPSTTRLVPD